jgi:protein-tyrosine-phosphatase
VPSNAIAGELDRQPAFLELVAHPLRWRLLQELARSDRAVKELTERLEQPQNLVSYHLRRLRDGQLVAARRSAADRRDTYYAIDLLQCERQLQATGGALHPALRLTSPPARTDAAAGRRRRRVLFLCTGNSARSQMAEALIEHLSDGRVTASSAGSNPKPLHPLAVKVMRKRGIDISANRTKHLDEFVGQRFDVVITLCDRVREVCPEFPAQPELVHWSVPDPSRAGPSARASYLAFEETAADLETRIRFLLPVLTGPATPAARRSTHA